jgi:hypothetical protein
MFNLTSKVAALSALIAGVVCTSVSKSCPPGYSQLASKLSSTAEIYSPGSDSFDAAIARWSNASVPVANVVVVPGTENDVVETASFFRPICCIMF